jgi:hypothetical protein
MKSISWFFGYIDIFYLVLIISQMIEKLNSIIGIALKYMYGSVKLSSKSYS